MEKDALPIRLFRCSRFKWPLAFFPKREVPEQTGTMEAAMKWKQNLAATFAVMVCIAFAGVLFSFSPVFSQGGAPAGYEQAKVELDRLRNDEKRAQYRHEWLKAAAAFLEIYNGNKAWSNRPAALFRSAEALEEMARRSFVRKDAQDAASRFEQLARTHPQSVLADDALYRAAVIRHELMRDAAEARTLLLSIGKKYPKADFAPKAVTYIKKIDDSHVASLAPATDAPKPESGRALVSKVTPQLRGNDVTRIVVSLNKPASWRIRFQSPDAKSDRPPRLILEFSEAGPDKSLGSGERYTGMGILKRYAVDYTASEGKTVIFLDFADLYCYTVKAEKSPFRIIIETTAGNGVLTGGITVKDSAAQTAALPGLRQGASSGVRGGAPANVAAQLGLTVKTIIIDPGHGGKDPGAMHNGIVEREVSLDIAKRLANVLRAAGYKVILTRDKDVFVPLLDRPQVAASKKGDLFLSIHVNASKKPDKAGFETYILDLNGTREAMNLAAVENEGSSRTLGEMDAILKELQLSARVQESRRLAGAVQEKAISRLRRGGYKTENGGIRGALFQVLMGSSMPGVLIEVGYCSNAAEAKLLKQGKYRDAIAEGIANGVHHYARQLETAGK